MNLNKVTRYSCLVLACSAICFLAGCETTKKILGTSTQALEEARADGLSETFSCSFDECYEVVLGLQRTEKGAYAMDGSNELLDQDAIRKKPKVSIEKDAAVEDAGVFDIFRQDRVRGIIVVMGIEGNVDTTEVGIFFTREAAAQTNVEISSLSSTAKRKMAESVFGKLRETFKKIP